MSSGIRRITPLAALLIVTLATGCDNVDWGGIRVSIVHPAPRGGKLTTAAKAPGERLPEGPVLFYVRVDSAGHRGVIYPVAEIQSSGLGALTPVDPAVYEPAFIHQHFEAGTRYLLFRRGQQSGMLTVDSAGNAAPDACRPLPHGIGDVKLDRNTEVREFLALVRPRAATAEPTPPKPPTIDRRMRFVAPILANQALDARHAALPTDWSHALAQLTAFPVEGSDDAAFAATFLVGDTLAQGLDDVGESLFYVAVPRAQVGYDTVYVRFADYANTGKSAPRLIDYLDWNHDGQPDLLLDVYTTRRSHFMAVGGTDDNWHTLLDETCQPLPPPDTTTLPAESAQTTVGQSETSRSGATTQPTSSRRVRRPPPANTMPALPQIQPKVGVVGHKGAPGDTARRDTARRDTTPRPAAPPPDTTPRPAA
ncbi:MAG: hypothetical protein P8099_05360 [Gemmatimonadota bacterium]|jgi:hypothetical protein